MSRTLTEQTQTAHKVTSQWRIIAWAISAKNQMYTTSFMNVQTLQSSLHDFRPFFNSPCFMRLKWSVRIQRVTTFLDCNRLNYDNGIVVYFDQRLGASDSKSWLK